MFIVFWFQAVLISLVALPFQFAFFQNQLIHPNLVYLGVLISLIGIIWETIADFQLSNFKSNPMNEGKVLDSGLWNYSRHPNYFGDFLFWWGIFIICISLGTAIWTIIGPIIMSVFLMKISGVTLLEKSLVKRKENYGDYIEKTNTFFPWFPKKSKQLQAKKDLIHKAVVIFALSIGFFASPLNAAEIKGIEFKDSMSFKGSSLKLSGLGFYRYAIIFKVLAAAVYIEKNSQKTPFLEVESSKRIEIHYLQNFTKKEFKDVTIKFVRENNSKELYEKHFQSLKKFNELYRDIKPGDRYAITYLKNAAVYLEKNGQVLGFIKASSELANLIFKIWFGEDLVTV